MRNVAEEVAQKIGKVIFVLLSELPMEFIQISFPYEVTNKKNKMYFYPRRKSNEKE